MNVLSIDGGGVRGIIPAAILAHWEAETGHSATERFGLFAGTSTGSILAGSMAAGLSAAQAFQLFRNETAAIFQAEQSSVVKRALRFKGWALPAFSREHLREVLIRHVGDVTLGACPKPLVIAALDVVTGSPKLFRSWQLPGGGPDKDIRLVDAILASTAAPVLFPSVRVASSTYVDGALWANNPGMAAMLEAAALESGGISMLSVGCGKPIWGGRVGFGANRGLVGWGVPLVTLMLAAQSEGVHEYVSRLLPADAYLRINPVLPRHLARIDAVENLEELTAHAQRAAIDALPELRRRFE